MTDALAKIYNQQQAEIAEKNRQQQLAREKHQREVHAFQTSGIPALFIELADVPNRPEIKFRKTFGEMTYTHYDPRTNKNRHEISVINENGNYAGRWWCAESPDTGRMKYCHEHNNQRLDSNTPEGPWLDAFIEFAARVCDPAAIAELHGKPQAPAGAKVGKRKLQPI